MAVKPAEAMAWSFLGSVCEGLQPMEQEAKARGTWVLVRGAMVEEDSWGGGLEESAFSPARKASSLESGIVG